MPRESDVPEIIHSILKKLPHGMAVEEVLKAAIIGVCEATELYLHDHEIAEIFSEVIKPEVRGESSKDMTIVQTINFDMLAATLETKLELARIRKET